MHVIGYYRVSTEEQGHTRNGLEAQIQAVSAFCTQHGHTLEAGFEEVASGATGLSERQQLRVALARARQAKGVLLVARLDRLSRSVAFVSALMAEGVRFATVEDGLDCQPVMLHLKAVMAEHERALISQRTRAALQAKKARGEPLGHYTHTLPGASLAHAQQASRQVSTAKADAYAVQVAPMLKALQASGLTMAAIACHMNDQGIATRRGGKWHASGVCTALARAGSA